MTKSKHSDIQMGEPSPLGARVRDDGVNFAFFSRNARRVRLELFDRTEDSKASRGIDFDPQLNRTGDVWHIWIKGIQPSQLYAYRVDGPYDPKAGHRFNFNKLLLDPFATAITKWPHWDFDQALGYNPSIPDGDFVPSTIDNAGAMPKCVITQEYFDWQGDRPPGHPWSRTIIYETHLRGCTIHPSSQVKHPGTYRGLIEKIPYFKELGVTALELMPIQEFNESQVTSILGKSLRNYWGYDPVLFLAPKASYSSGKGLDQPKQEFREMVLAFHKAGIEIILDVVFNHTAETDLLGSTLNYRGIDNTIFYLLEDDQRFYKNYTGTGNTINANHPVVQEHILSALRYWVQEMHVDGFRFDLASILSRDTKGSLQEDAPILKTIARDTVLKDVKIIAEPWDAAGAYQLGHFSDQRWVEWNDRYRDDIRRFWRGDDGMLGAFANRICGSADIFAHLGKGPQNSINFITCHDGFTLNDMVSYRNKHNELNRQNNNDGANENFSDNYGFEGQTTDKAIESLRKRQIKNFLLTLFISRGVPMLLGADEFRRTQKGNNNAYCQDNETSWYDWNCLKQHREIFDFTRGMIALRRAHPILSKEQFYTNTDILWFSPQGELPNWSHSKGKQLACLIQDTQELSLFLMFNASSDSVDFHLPTAPMTTQWYLAVDTSLEGSQDAFAAKKESLLDNPQTYRLKPQSSAILLKKMGKM
ncbi:MAG: glycogen debranching protein GlgX [Candidatus Omnitrophica bacterium]|nr:glycogen debranching protein GlgX [Candidatus Omnitrophota bacterium]